jgi:hypothetical protein
LQNDRRPLLSATYFQTFRILAKEFMPQYLPELADKIANDTRLINNQKSQKYTKKIATAILKKNGDKSALNKLEEEDKEANAEAWEEKCQLITTEYAKAAKEGNTKKKQSILAKLEKTRPKGLAHKEIFVAEIFRKFNLLSYELKQLELSPDTLCKLSTEDIRPLKSLYAKWSANISRERGGEYLGEALKNATASGIIKITQTKPLTFIINTKEIQLMIRRADLSEHENVVQLVNCLLVENVAQAQALWDAVRLHSYSKSDVFIAAKDKLVRHLDRCQSYIDSWQSNPELNQNFCIKWTNFQLDTPKKPSLIKKLTGKFSNH